MFITRTPCPLPAWGTLNPPGTEESFPLPPGQSNAFSVHQSGKSLASFKKEADCLTSQEPFFLFPCLARGGRKAQEAG